MHNIHAIPTNPAGLENINILEARQERTDFHLTTMAGGGGPYLVAREACC